MRAGHRVASPAWRCSPRSRSAPPPAPRTPTPAPAGSDGAPRPTPIKSGLKIAFLPKQVNNPYFDTSDNKGGKVAVEEFKGVYSETGPSEASPSAQVSYINTLSQQGTNVIVVSANDKDAICGALNEARKAGAKVVTYDSDTKPDVPGPVHQPGHRRGHREGPDQADLRGGRRRTAARSRSCRRRRTRRTRTPGSR